MRQQRDSMRFVDIQLKVTFVALLASLVWYLQGAGAGGLADVVTNLYGGQGILLQPPPQGFSHAAHFFASSLQGLDALNSSITSSLGFLAFNSTVTGFTFDIEQGVPVRTTESFGPLLAERASTVGAGKFNLGFTYTRIDFTRFEGKPLSHLSLDFTHDDVNGDGVLGPTSTFTFDFERDVIRVDLDLTINEDVFGIFATYGLTRRWDVGIVVPITHILLRAEANATIIRNSVVSTLVHNFGPQSTPPRSTGGGEATGIGDIILRTKYNFLRNRPSWPDLAIVGDLKLPTGDEDDLLGTGTTNLKGLLVASRSFGILTPHVNVGYEVVTGPSKESTVRHVASDGTYTDVTQTIGGSRESNVRYIAGLDAGVHPSLTLAFDVLGRWKPHGDGIADHTVDLALGARWNLFRTFLLNGIVQLPLNKNEGLRADVIWTVGAEYTF